MRNLLSTLLLSIFGGCILLPVLSAQTADPLAIDFKVERKIVRADNSVQWVDGSQAEPGQVLRYQAVYRNQSDRTLRNIKASVPIPENVLCLWASANPIPDEVSLDGREFISWTEFQKPMRATAEGPIPPVRTLRWLIRELPAGQEATVSVEAAIPVSP